LIRLFLYPKLFGLPDNNPYGLKVETFLRLAQIPYHLEHVVNVGAAPRGQLPYLVDGATVVSDSNRMIEYLSQTYQVNLDDVLTHEQRTTHFLVTRMLDSHLYWVMSYSRWQDPRFWPIFKAAFLKNFPQVSETELDIPRKNNIEKYRYQGIGRYDPAQVYESGIDDLRAIQSLLGSNQYMFGDTIHTIDACCYGFLANIWYFDIDTPLKDFLRSNPLVTTYIERVRSRLGY
jgi:glutathione S-transferase